MKRKSVWLVAALAALGAAFPSDAATARPDRGAVVSSVAPSAKHGAGERSFAVIAD